MSLLKPMIGGAIGDELATQASARGMNVIPYQDKVGGLAGGYMANKSLKGAGLGLLGGMLKDMVLGRNPMTNAGTNSGTNMAGVIFNQ
ncbi:MAG: hypothetical protein NTU93_18620 [Arthrobacter sp.]|nr:hypothetical protein [Arthrobacter sp.]